MIVPISCGVSRGIHLEYVWFNLKKWDLASRENQLIYGSQHVLHPA